MLTLVHDLLYIIGLEKPKLKNLIRDVKVTCWFQIGLELIEDESEMNIIKANHKHDVKGALQDTFDLWLRTCESPTWQRVINALRKCEENSLAHELEKKCIFYN